MSEEEAETIEVKPKSGGKKLLIIGLFVGLLLGGGGGFGAYMILAGGDKHEPSEEEKVVVEKPKVVPFYVKVDRLTLPLIHNNRVLGNIVIDFSMEVDGNENKMAVINSLPEIRDAMLRHFSDTPIGKTDSPRNVDYPRLKETLKDISNEVLQDPLVMQVMVGQGRQL